MVTGAGGFLGKSLVGKLLTWADTELMAVCHSEAKCPDFPEHSGFRTLAVDLENEQETAALMTDWKPDVVFHLAAVSRLQAGQENPERAVRMNLLGSIRLLHSAARHGTKIFLFTSSDLAREARSVVGVSKLLMEHYLRLFPEPLPAAVTFRMPNLYDFPGSVMDIFARQIAQNKDLTITDERMARRFITREEAVDDLLYLMENGENHQVYSVKQEPVFIKDMALKMIADSGKDLKLKVIGARPGEKLYQASYSDREALDTGFHHLARLRLAPPSMEKIFACIRKLPVSKTLRAELQNRFARLF